MKQVLDTSILIEIERGSRKVSDAITEVQKTIPGSPFISFATYFEVLRGIKGKNLQNKQKAEAYLEQFEVLQTTKRTAHILSDLKDKYELPLADLLIAAQTIEAQGMLITQDKDFLKIKELHLKIISW